MLLATSLFTAARSSFSVSSSSILTSTRSVSSFASPRVHSYSCHKLLATKKTAHTIMATNKRSLSTGLASAISSLAGKDFISIDLLRYVEDSGSGSVSEPWYDGTSRESMVLFSDTRHTQFTESHNNNHLPSLSISSTNTVKPNFKDC